MTPNTGNGTHGNGNATDIASDGVRLAPPSPISGVQLRIGKGIGGKKGKSGRKPLDIALHADALLSSAKARRATRARCCSSARS